MKVRYLKDVDSPPTQAGRIGEVRDIVGDDLKHLMDGRFVEDVLNPWPVPGPVVVDEGKGGNLEDGVRANQYDEKNDDNDSSVSERKNEDVDEKTNIGSG